MPTADAVFLTGDVLDRKPIQVKALRGGRKTVRTEYDAMGSIQTAGNRLPQCGNAEIHIPSRHSALNGLMMTHHHARTER